MKNRALKIILIICFACFIVLSLAGCQKIKDFLNGGSSGGNAPKISAVFTEKKQEDWYNSKEYLFNRDCTNPMALNDGEEYYIVIQYNNPDKMSVSSVKINGKKYDSISFENGSGTDMTKILFSVEDQASTRNITYTINNVLYINGTSTKNMGYEANVPNNVTVAVRPSFKLTLNDMNLDYRAENYSASMEGSEVRVGSSNAYFGTRLSNFSINAPDFSKANSAAIAKRGGWIFAGWFTKPNGEGTMITDDDVYYFWCDITLYAYFDRMYNIKVVPLDSPLEYTYGSDGRTRYTSGAVITNREWGKDQNHITHYPSLEIPNTVVVENVTYSESTGEFGIPVYNVRVARTEYPVIKIDNLAFKGFNTIENVSVGKLIEEIGYGAFWNCDKIKTFNFNDGSVLKYIGDYAFRDTEALGINPAFDIPSTVEYIGSLAFRNSGWSNVKQSSGGGTTTLTVRNTWKYIGFQAFYGTGFNKVVFQPDCSFDSQIAYEEGKTIESANGEKEIQRLRNGEVENRIGASLFEGCRSLTEVEILNDEGKSNALNIVPDRCFEIFGFKDSKKILRATFGEGIKYIGMRAFYYQEAIENLSLPATLEEVDIDAFYQCISVKKLEFADDSQLRILHNSAFGNLTSVDSVTIKSTLVDENGLPNFFYGSGPFRGCDRLKCVIFANAEAAPKGYLKEESDAMRGTEVVVGHKQADFLYASGEAGEKQNVNEEDINNKDAKTYSSPLRIFCPAVLLEDFEREMKNGKELTAAGHSTGTSAFSSSVFVHKLDNLKDYTYYDEDLEETVTVQIAVQEIYRVSSNTKTNQIVGYSLVYWSDRNTYIRLPQMDNVNLSDYPIIELAYYAVPTSVRKIVIPSSYKRIDHDAFNGCTSLVDVEFEDPDAVEYIGDYAFFGTGIKSFIGGEGLKVIGQYAFQRCLSLKVVDLHRTAIINAHDGSKRKRDMCKYDYEIEDDENDYNNILGYGAFKGCKSLTWIYLPYVEQIPTALFTNCKALHTVIIPTLGATFRKTIDGQQKLLDDSANNDYAFYQYGEPNTIYDPSTVHQLEIVVDQTALEAHKKIYPRDDYKTISPTTTEMPSY